MKFFDTLKISFHSIFHNKLRTLITIVIVFVVSLLIMAISIIGLSFYTSINTAFIEMYDKTGATFDLSSYYNNSETNNEWRGINSSEYSLTMAEFEKYPEIVDNVVLMSGNMESYYFYDLDVSPSQTELDLLFHSNEFYNSYSDSRSSCGIVSSWGDLDSSSEDISYLKSGRLWNKEDEGLKKVWVSETFVLMAVNYGVYLEVGDYVVLSFTSNIKNGDTYEQVIRSDKFKITGILLSSALLELDNDKDFFIDVFTAYNMMGENVNVVDNLYVINEPRIGYIFEDEYKKMSNIVKAVNSQIEPNVDQNDRERDRFRCDLVENLSTTRIIGFVMIGASVFICFIILVISIGSVANSIIISVDKNKRFLGVMMAVGLNNRGVNRIVQYESLLIIILATGAAYGMLRLFDQYFMPVIDFLMTLPGFTESSIVIMPVYIPIITVLAFIGMALLFARKSLAKIINMDVISVISEVA